MDTEWILVANAIDARVLRSEPGSPLAVLYAFHRADGRLAQELARHLEPAACEGRFERLRVVGTAAFLGALETALGRAARALLQQEQVQDLTDVCLCDLQRRLGS